MTEIETLERRLANAEERLSQAEQLVLKHAKRHDAGTAADPLTITSSAHARQHAISSAADHTGTLGDSQIPAAIARDTEVTAEIATHAAIAAAHHAKYTDAEAVAAVQGEATLDLVGILTIGDTGFQLYKSGALYYIKWGANDYLLLTDDFIGFYVGGGLALSATPTASEFTVPVRLLNNLSVQFREASGSGTQQVTLKGPASLAADRAITLPDADGELALEADITAHEAAADPHTAYLTPAEHTAVGDGAPHHSRYTDTEALTAVPYEFYITFGADPVNGQVYAP